MRCVWNNCWFLIGVAFLGNALPVIDALVAATAEGEGAVEVEWDEEKGSESESRVTSTGIDSLFKDPAFLTNISSGVDSLNRSIDSLMDALFYSLMDNRLSFDVTDSSQFGVELKRDVYSTTFGEYVVADRFSLGPNYLVNLTSVNGIPVDLGANGTVNILNIYPRSDGLRLMENQELPFWRVAVNNWFGLLPLLSNILPPSFNPNEMYDPLKELETPFLFPLDEESVFKMPIGSIRSYSLSGGLFFPMDLLGAKTQADKEKFLNVEDVTAEIPYTVFRSGEHRINVLRRSEYEVWVGVSDVERFGHGIRAALGKTYLVFQKMLPYWGGMPAPVFPINFELDAADANKFDHLYEFDLRKEPARVAYRQAVRGNFREAHNRYLDHKEQKLDTGVLFHFKRKQRGLEYGRKNSRNLVIQRNTRKSLHSDSEIEITDGQGIIHILEADVEIRDEAWDALVGSENLSFNNRLEIKVDKAKDPESGMTRYIISPSDTNPVSLVMTFRVNDKFVDVTEYRDYVQMARLFTNLGFELPYLPLRDNSKLRGKRREMALMDPVEDVRAIHVTPTHLGEMGVNASVHFDTRNLERIIKSSENKLWQAFARAYGVPREAWATASARFSFANSMRWLAAVTTYPLRALNIRISAADAIRDTTFRIAAIQKAAKTQHPIARMEAFGELLNTDYPVQLARALLFLSKSADIPRQVTFNAKKKGKGADATKQLFEQLNNRVFKSGAAFPSHYRSRIARDKLAAFVPEELQEIRQRPVVSKIHIDKRLVDVTPAMQKRMRGGLQPHVYINLNVSKVPPGSKVKFYVKVEQGGEVNVGRFVLADQIISLSPDRGSGAGASTNKYGFYLTGPYSPFKGFLFDRAVEFGGVFDLSIAASVEGEVWSEERKVSFRFEGGALRKP